MALVESILNNARKKKRNQGFWKPYVGEDNTRIVEMPGVTPAAQSASAAFLCCE